MLNFEVFTFNPFQENTYLLWDETKEAIIIDPGCYEDHEKKELTSFIEQNDLKPVRLLNTHCHIDHALGNFFIQNKYSLKVEAHSLEKQILAAIPAYAANYGFAEYQSTEIEIELNEGEQVLFGNTTLDILFLPGHAPGHIAFLEKETKNCFLGDVLFKGSIGRTDLPGGDFDTLIKSIKEKLFLLDVDIVAHPGHGPNTTIGVEKRTNPFLT